MKYLAAILVLLFGISKAKSADASDRLHDYPFAPTESDSVARIARRAALRALGTPSHSLHFFDQERVVTRKDYSRFVRQLLNHHALPDQLEHYLRDLFRMSPRLNARPATEMGSIDHRGAFSAIIREIFEYDRPWTNVFTSQATRIEVSERDLRNRISGYFYSIPSDLSFFANLFPELRQKLSAEAPKYYRGDSSTPTVALMAQTAAQKSQLAGVVTTPQFMIRHGNSSTNFNFGRTAHLMRIMLCNDLTAVSLTADPNEIANQRRRSLRLVNPNANQKLLPSNSNATDGSANLQTQLARHGSDPQCQSCHAVLDPNSEFWAGSNNTLSRHPIRSFATFRRANGELVRIPALGLAGLMQELTRQPEFYDCQVRHFWNWIVGEDVPLSEDRQAALVAHWKRSGYRPKPLIEQLLLSPEFLSIDSNEMRPSQSSSPQLVESRARTVLNRCDQCHAHEPLAPRVSALDQLDPELASKIAESVSTRVRGTKDQMPPKDSEWQLSVLEVAAVVDWFRAGAPDRKGAARLSPKVTQAIDPETSLDRSQVVAPNFSNQGHRLMRNFTFFQAIDSTFRLGQPRIQLLPDSANPNGALNRLASHRESRPLPTMLSPVSGRPVAQFPYNQELSQLIQYTEFALAPSSLAQTSYFVRLIQSLRRSLGDEWLEGSHSMIANKKVSEIPTAYRGLIADHVIETWFGPRSLGPRQLSQVTQHVLMHQSLALARQPDSLTFGQLVTLSIQAAIFNDLGLLE